MDAQASEATSERLAAVQGERDNACARAETLEASLEAATQEAGADAAAAAAAAAATAADVDAAATTASERATQERGAELEEVRRQADSALERVQVRAWFGVRRTAVLEWIVGETGALVFCVCLSVGLSVCYLPGLQCNVAAVSVVWLMLLTTGEVASRPFVVCISHRSLSFFYFIIPVLQESTTLIEKGVAFESKGAKLVMLAGYSCTVRHWPFVKVSHRSRYVLCCAHLPLLCRSRFCCFSFPAWGID